MAVDHDVGLHERGISCCGSGVLARHLSDAGHDVLGIDRSPAMIALARRHAPKATFRVASVVDARLPSCNAVTVFDLAGPGRVPGGVRRSFAEGRDWAVLVQAHEAVPSHLLEHTRQGMHPRTEPLPRP